MQDQDLTFTEKSSKDCTSQVIWKVGPIFLFALSLVLIIVGSVCYVSASKANSGLVGSCQVTILSSKICEAVCTYGPTTLPSVQIDCKKSYKLDITKGPPRAVVFKSTVGFIAMIVVGSVVISSLMVGLLLYVACPYAFCEDAYTLEDDIESSSSETRQTEVSAAEPDTETIDTGSTVSEGSITSTS
jgi:hypothetical protein